MNRGFSSTARKSLSQTMREILGSRSPREIVEGGRPLAAVLIPVFRENGEYKVLFTQRTHTVEHHKGQVSFPGGVVEEEDASTRDTALREAREEIGLLENDVEILGRTDDAETLASNFVIHPYVGLVPWPYNFVLSRHEVERLIAVPITVFEPGSRHAGRQAVEYQGRIYAAEAYTFKDVVIWGATARMMGNLMEIVGGRFSLPSGAE